LEANYRQRSRIVAEVFLQTLYLRLVAIRRRSPYATKTGVAILMDLLIIRVQGNVSVLE
jgi:hypothetical protein